MIKKKIKTNMVIEDGTGRQSVVIGTMLIGTTAALTLNSYKNNLKYKSKDKNYRKLDVVRVYEQTRDVIEGSFNRNCLKLIWERK